MNKPESIQNLAKALAAFQSEVKNPANTANNPFFKSKYAPLNEILNDVRPLLSKNGLSVLQAPSGDGENIIVTTMLMHSSGEWIEADPLILKADKPTAQGAGSAITYARRYALSAILGISSEDDDDGNHASDNEKGQKNNKETEKPTTLSEAQIKRLFAIGANNGYNAETVKKAILKHYEKTSAGELTKAQYDELIANIESNPMK